MAVLAVNGGEPVIKSRFPRWPICEDSDIESVERVLRSGRWEWFSGTRVAEFEKRFAGFQQVDHVAACTNGTVAIEILLEALGVGAGDEVIVPDYTYMATAGAPARRGAKVVLVDVDPDTFCLDPQLTEQAISDRTKAIIPVHFGGHPCDMGAIMGLAEKRDLHVITDCAHAHGAQWEGRHVGGIAHAGTFSFQASKTLAGCGEGGAVVSNNEELIALCRSLNNFGRVAGGWAYHHVRAGTNNRMSELQAALLLAQLARLESQCRRREQNGKLLTELISEIDGVKPQARAPGLTRHGYYLFTFILEADIPREPFRRALAAEGVLLQDAYPAIHTLEFIRKTGMDGGNFPVSDLLASRSIWLYHNCLLGDEPQVRLIAEAVRKVLANRRELDKITT